MEPQSIRRSESKELTASSLRRLYAELLSRSIALLALSIGRTSKSFQAYKCRIAFLRIQAAGKACPRIEA